MLFYKIGCNFDPRLIGYIETLNEKYQDTAKITEVYGSDKKHAFLTARPTFRLPDVNQKQFETYIKLCNLAEIEFNYTLNAMYPGSKRDLDRMELEITEFIKWLSFVGVSRLTIANPILFEFIKHRSSELKLEISTIAHIDTVSQIKYYHEQFGVDKICMNLLKNRDISFLRAAAKYANRIGVNIELMVNEFCGVGGDKYVTHCVFRDSCYMAHSTNETREDALLFNNYPMGYCMTARNSHNSSWLKTRFIRPEDIQRYASLGISHFKITGRTGTTAYLVSVAEAYMSQSFEENLLMLWKPLETIYSGKSESEHKYRTTIPNEVLDGFVDKWFENEDFSCSNEVCGETCTYCNDFYDSLGLTE